MKLSIIVCTRNRAHAIIPCLDSITKSLNHAALVDAEIVVVDNASSDNTSAIVGEWAKTCAFPVQLLFETKKGLGSAHNCALRSARGELLAITDDDCQLSKEYIADLLRHDAADTDPVLRGGRVELGDPTDLPLTIKTGEIIKRWSRKLRSARHEKMPGCIIGCNMAMRRTIVDKIGLFDERFGPGTSLAAGDETDYVFRAYLAGITIEYVPDMVILHFHGRKTISIGNKLLQNYTVSQGGIYAKYIFKHFDFIRPAYWDFKGAIRNAIHGIKHDKEKIGLPYRKIVSNLILGAMRYYIASIKSVVLQ